MGQDREDDGLRQEVDAGGRRLREEDDPRFQSRRQSADLATEAARRHAIWRALGWFCFWEWVGAAVGLASLHAQDPVVGRVILWAGYLLGNGGAFAAVWYSYFVPERRGEW